MSFEEALKNAKEMCSKFGLRLTLSQLYEVALNIMNGKKTRILQQLVPTNHK